MREALIREFFSVSSVVRMNTKVSMDPTPTNAAQVGDLITYAYHFERWGIKDFGVTTRAVIAVIKDGAGKTTGYYVDGDYRVELSAVQSVIPMHEGEALAAGPQGQGFPLEPGQ
jgi:hypothetical protein